MKKQNKNNAREKKGFVLYADDLLAAEELLPDFERRGQLFSIITAYATGRELPQVPDLVRASFVYIRNGIIANNAKYERKLERQAEYNKRQREKLEKLAELEHAEKSQVPQVEQDAQATQSTINNSINDRNGNGDGNGTDNGNGISNGNGNRHGNSNGNKNTVNSISSNTEYLKNNSLSENKYTLDAVREILERERIFFKQNWLRDFYTLNSQHYKWKYEPVSAAQAFIRLHPEAVSGKRRENVPPSSAAPPNGIVGAVYSEMEADGYRKACEYWNLIYSQISSQLSDEDKSFLRDNVRPDIVWQQGYTVKCLRFTLNNAEQRLEDLAKRADSILAPHVAIFNKYGIKKIQYRAAVAENAKE